METTESNKKSGGWLSLLAIDLSPLRASREYRLLYFGQFISYFGSAISYVLLPWQMYQLTKSSFAVGMLGVAEFIPMFLMAFVGGALADSMDRRKLIVFSEVMLAICSLILMGNAMLPQPQVWVLFVIATLFAAFNGLHRPALEAITPRIVPLEMMPAVGALHSFAFGFNFIIGPAIGGLIASTAGAAVAYGVDAATFIIFLGMLTRMNFPASPANEEQPAWQSIKEGWAYARSRQELLGTYLVDLNAMFFGMPMALFPAIAEQFGGASVGLFYSMVALGSMAVSLTSGWTERVKKHGWAITIAASVWGLAIIGFGLATNLWLALFFLALAGAADNVSGLFRMTIWNQTIPDRLRGRLAGIEMISYTTGPYLGNAEAGLVAHLFGLRASVVSGGVLCVLGSVVLAALLPRFLRYDGREGLAQKEAEEAAFAELKAEKPGSGFRVPGSGFSNMEECNEPPNSTLSR